MANLILALAAFSFVLTGCLGHPGGAMVRNKCPPKPPTIQEFNATEVGNGLKMFRYYVSNGWVHLREAFTKKKRNFIKKVS